MVGFRASTQPTGLQWLSYGEKHFPIISGTHLNVAHIAFTFVLRGILSTKSSLILWRVRKNENGNKSIYTDFRDLFLYNFLYTRQGGRILTSEQQDITSSEKVFLLKEIYNKPSTTI